MAKYQMGRHRFPIEVRDRDIKIRPCIRCGVRVQTTTHYRFCPTCRDYAKTVNERSDLYSSHGEMEHVEHRPGQW